MFARLAFAATLALATSAQAARVEFNPVYAKDPAPGSYEAAVTAFLERQLLDPYSAVVKLVRTPRYARLPTSLFTSATGWIVCYQVNAKNAYGGYTGNKLHAFILEGGQVKDHETDDERKNSFIASSVRRECQTPADELEPGREATSPPAGSGPKISL